MELWRGHAMSSPTGTNKKTNTASCPQSEERPNLGSCRILPALSRLGSGTAVPIRDIVKNDCAFTPEDTKALSAAFEETLSALSLVDREDPITMFVARLIVDLAKEGERDPARLCDLALKAVSRRSGEASSGSA